MLLIVVCFISYLIDCLTTNPTKTFGKDKHRQIFDRTSPITSNFSTFTHLRLVHCTPQQIPPQRKDNCEIPHSPVFFREPKFLLSGNNNQPDHPTTAHHLILSRRHTHLLPRPEHIKSRKNGEHSEDEKDLLPWWRLQEAHASQGYPIQYVF